MSSYHPPLCLFQVSASLASAGSLGSSSSFLSAISAIYNYAYLSSTTTAAATASLAAGSTTAAAYSAATSPASVANATAAIAASPTSAALVCALLAAAARSDSDAAAASQYRTLCLGQASSAPSVASDYTWLAPLIVCTVAGIIIIAIVVVCVARRFRADVGTSRPGLSGVDAAALAAPLPGPEPQPDKPWSGVALRYGAPVQPESATGPSAVRTGDVAGTGIAAVA